MEPGEGPRSGATSPGEEEREEEGEAEHVLYATITNEIQERWVADAQPTAGAESTPSAQEGPVTE